MINFFHLKIKHHFHVLQRSSIPHCIAFVIAIFLLGQVLWLHSTENLFLISLNKVQNNVIFLLLLAIILFWTISIQKESSNGFHTKIVQTGLKWGFYFFLVSEIMLFFSFFWAYFFLSINPSISAGGVWPSEKTQLINAWHLPLYNTIVLLLSGYTVTLAHNYILNSRFNTDKALQSKFTNSVGLTIFLGLIFLISQCYEYKYGVSAWWGNNSLWGCFFILTGFHGTHVLFGIIFLIFNFLKNFPGFISAFFERSFSLYLSKALHRHIKSAINPVSRGIDKFTAFFDVIFLKNNLRQHSFFSKNETVLINTENDLATKLEEKLVEKNAFQLNTEQQLGFETCLFYWHFVDIVWLFLYVIVYIWGQ